MKELILSAIGPDRPGLVDELAEALTRRGVNIADSRMVNLRGRFALVMLVQSRAAEPPLAEELTAEAERLGLRASVQPSDQAARENGGGAAVRPAVPYRIRTYAMDQAGLVHRITHALHVRGVNIEELNTRLEHAPHTGAPIFSMDMVVSIPQQVELKRVREDLEELCAELNCDLDIDRA